MNKETLKELELTISSNFISFDGETYTYKEPSKKKLIKALSDYHGRKQITSDIVQYIMELKRENSLDISDIKETPEELLFDYIIPKKNIRYEEEHEILISNVSGFEVSEDNLGTFISTANDEYSKMVGKDGLKWSNDVLINTYKEFKINNFHDKVQKIRQTVSHNLNNEYDTDVLLDELLDAMNISHEFHDLFNNYKTDKYRDVAKLVFKQIIWLIKRNLFNKRTKNEMMMFFYGEQGIGKTYAFEKVFKTLFTGLYIGDCKLETLLEERQVELWTRKLIVNFDDASTSGNNFNTKSMGEIKSKLSNESITYRPMKSNESKTVVKKFTAVSTTNIDFKELIQDSTGARRFFQLISDNGINELFDSSYFDGADIEEKMKQLWISVDENNEDGFIFDKTNPTIKVLEEIQKSYVKLDTQSSFHKEFDFAHNKKEASVRDKITFSKAYQLYLEFCDENQVKHKKSKQSFFTTLVKDVFWTEEKLSNGKFGKKCYINEDNADGFGEDDDLVGYTDKFKTKTDKFKSADDNVDDDTAFSFLDDM